MTQSHNIRKPPIADLWLLVDEEQNMHYGLRQAWRWLEAERQAPPQPASQPGAERTYPIQLHTCLPAACLAV